MARRIDHNLWLILFSRLRNQTWLLNVQPPIYHENEFNQTSEVFSNKIMNFFLSESFHKFTFFIYVQFHETPEAITRGFSTHGRKKRPLMSKSTGLVR